MYHLSFHAQHAECQKCVISLLFKHSCLLTVVWMWCSAQFSTWTSVPSIISCTTCWLPIMCYFSLVQTLLSTDSSVKVIVIVVIKFNSLLELVYIILCIICWVPIMCYFSLTAVWMLCLFLYSTWTDVPSIISCTTCWVPIMCNFSLTAFKHSCLLWH